MLTLQFLFDPKQMTVNRRVAGVKIGCVICREATQVILVIEDKEQPIAAKERPPKINFPVCLTHAEIVEDYIRTKMFYPFVEDSESFDAPLPFQPVLL